MKRWMLFGMGLAIALLAPLNLMAQDADQPQDKPAAAARPAAPVDPAVLLKAIPADATAFVAVPNLKQLDQDVQETATALGFPPNTLPSISQWFKDSLKLAKGFNENGSVALVLLDASKAATAEELESRLVVFFAASDAKALAEAMGGETAGDVIKLELSGNPAFAATRGEFLVVAKDESAIKSLAEAKGDGLVKALPAERQKLMAKQDVFAWVNLRGVSKELCDSIAAEIEKNVSGTPFSGMMSGMSDLKDFVQQGEELALGLSLDPKRGLGINFFVSMKPDTELGKQMASMKPASGSLLAGLPGDPFVGVLGTVFSPDTERQLKKVLETALSEEAIGDKVDKEKLGQVRDGLVKLIGSVEQLSLGAYGSKAAEDQGMVTVALVAKVKDSAAWKQDAKKLFNLGKDIAVEVAKGEGESDERVKQAADAVQWKDSAEKLGGADVDVLSVDLAKLPEAEEEQVGQVKKVLGPEGVTLRLGALGKDKVVVVFGGGTQRFEAIAKLAAGNEAPLTENKSVKLVADRIPAGPKLAEGYLNIDKLFELIVDISTEVGGGIPFPIALQNAAPVAFTSMKTGEAAQQTDVMIPIELVKSVADMVRPMLMMGLGGPQGPDEPEPPADNSELK